MGSNRYRVTMTALRALPAIALSLLLVGLAGCQPSVPAGLPSNQSSTPSQEPSPTATAVVSTQPEPLIDLACADFAGVASIGTLGGVTERDPRGVAAETLDVVPLADIVRNAGGIACEFSDGGAWRVQKADSFSLNESWHGAAIFIVPNVGTGTEELVSDSQCGDQLSGNRFSLCQADFAVGNSWVTVVSSTSDKGQTYRDVRDYVEDIVARAPSTQGPVARADGTFRPPRDCEALVPAAALATLLGGSNIVSDRSIQLHVAAEATFLTENTGCDWFRDGSANYAQGYVYPGGAWAADYALSKLDATPIEVAGLHDGDIALAHCTEVSEYDCWICVIDVVTDGTWLRGTGVGVDEATTTAIATAVVESILSHRG